MPWLEKISASILQAQSVKLNEEWKQRLFKLIDLTSLNETDTEESTSILCEKAYSSMGHVAAVCVYSSFVRLVADNFADKPVKAATVANFPQGAASLEVTLAEISKALQNGAQEIDVVFPYKAYLAGNKLSAAQYIMACKAACGEQVTLKVILETGALLDLDLIAEASRDVFLAGADFVKTSTGKIPQGATLEAAAVMLHIIHELTPTLNRRLGFKAAGGIQEAQQAIQYIALADHIMGAKWATPETFRIGASKLINEL